MKMDKENFIKYHFWYMLGLLVPLIFLVLIMLWTGTAGAISEQQKKIDEKKKALEGVVKSEARNQKWVDMLDKRLKLVTDQESKNWKQAWEPQANFMTWPPALAEKLKDAYFGDPIDTRLRADYTKEEQYASQIDPIIDLVQPVSSTGDGVVQCASGNWNSFLQTADWTSNPTPSTEEIWLAQEDLWVQRELLRIVREANDSVATFKKLEGAPPVDKSKNEIDHQIFVNPTWRIDLVLSGEVPKFHLHSSIINTSSQRQVLGINFIVGFRGTKATDTLFLDGEPLGPGQTIERDQQLGGQLELSPPEGLDNLKQVFDWRTAPVKRLDRIGLGYHGQRSSPRGVKSSAVFKGEAKGGAPGGSGGGQPARRSSRGGERAEGGSSDSGSNATASGLQRDRYIEETPYVRRMPIGIVLIVDQTNIQDVLTAVANSSLRVQITQWDWVRFHGNIKPPVPESVAQAQEQDNAPVPRPVARPVAQPVATPTAPTAPLVTAPKLGGGGFGSLGQAPGAPPPPPPPPPVATRVNRPLPPAARGARGAAARMNRAAAMEEQELELIELSVYGIASLYERYPPKSSVATGPAAAKPGAQPAAKGATQGKK